MESQGPRTNGAAGIGAYGLRVVGLDRARRLLLPAEAEWPRLDIRFGEPPEETSPQAPTATVRFVEGGARLCLSSSGYVEIARSPASATFRFVEAPSADAVVHPYLGGIASLVGRWLGRETIHAGAFVFEGGAWAVVGARQAGKSSLLAALAARGWDVLCDDMLVIDGGDVLAGPRSIDLRPDAAAKLGNGEPIGLVGARERWRLVLGSLETARVPLRGWLFLGWGDRVEVERVPPATILARLAEQTAIPGAPSDPLGLLGLAGLRGVELRRPPDWAAVGDAVDCLRDAVSG